MVHGPDTEQEEISTTWMLARVATVTLRTAATPSCNTCCAQSRQRPQQVPTPVAPPSPPATAVPGLTVVSILDDVHSAGAPPAWSRNGEVLAFSAMPADGSHGPDVYTWRQGDDVAQPLTEDHASYFASWSGRQGSSTGAGSRKVCSGVRSVVPGIQRSCVEDWSGAAPLSRL